MTDYLRYILLAAIACFWACFFALLFSGCKSVQPIAQTRDSVKVEFKRDSVIVIERDSVFRDRYLQGDTVFVTVERWQTRWRDRVQEVRDTVSMVQTQVLREKYVPAYYQWCSRLLWLLVVAALTCAAWRVAKLYFMHR